MNIANLSKDEILKRHFFKCIHGHTGIEHPSCFEEKNGIKEKIGFLDIETSNLKANWGFVFSYCIKDAGGEITKRVLSPEEIKSGIYDKKLLTEFCKEARKYDRLIGYFSARFDIPFLRTRCVFYGLDFPVFKEIHHTDLYDILKRKFSLHSKRLQVVAEYFKIPAKGHKMNPTVWFAAMAGDKKALAWILTHNEEDVITTELLWNKVNDYARITKTSI
jgi:uncharacterized protein YprB with RNaseH-like and TPR domain